MRLVSILRDLQGDSRGSTMLEMAFIIPVLVTLACGAADLSFCYARQLVLQQAAARTMEYAIARGSNGTLNATLQSEGAAAAGVASSNVVVDSWLECGGTRQSDMNGSCTGSDTPARFASITINDTYNWMFEQVVPSWNNAPYSVPLRGYAEVRIQ